MYMRELAITQHTLKDILNTPVHASDLLRIFASWAHQIHLRWLC